MSISIQGITKTFGNYRALGDINLEIASGELMALLGPSGCGKTTLLRLIAGLETADKGSILLHGSDISDRNPRERNVGFVFQHYALFRHMSVFENVAFGLKVQSAKLRPSKQEIKDRVRSLLKMVQMEWSEKYHPSQLSGGQRQRVALARALAVKPKVLLLDEPFSALDAKVRVELRRWLRQLHDDLHITSVFVTHDQEEALELADRVTILNAGKIEQTGSPEEVYDYPANAFVHQFIGNVNVFHARLHDGHMGIEQQDADNQSDKSYKGYVRPHEVGVSRVRSDDNELEAEIRDIRMFGSTVGLDLKLVGMEGLIEAEIPRTYCRELGLNKGDRVFVKLLNVRYYGQSTYEI